MVPVCRDVSLCNDAPKSWTTAPRAAAPAMTAAMSAWPLGRVSRATSTVAGAGPTVVSCTAASSAAARAGAPRALTTAVACFSHATWGEVVCCQLRGAHSGREVAGTCRQHGTRRVHHLHAVILLRVVAGLWQGRRVGDAGWRGFSAECAGGVLFPSPGRTVTTTPVAPPPQATLRAAARAPTRKATGRRRDAWVRKPAVPYSKAAPAAPHTHVGEDTGGRVSVR